MNNYTAFGEWYKGFTITAMRAQGDNSFISTVTGYTAIGLRGEKIQHARKRELKKLIDARVTR